MHPAYDPAPRRPLSRGERLGAFVFGVLLTAIAGAELASGGDPRKLSVLFVLGFWYPLLIVHELGHALCARWLGFRVHEIALGVGPELVRLSVGETRLIVRLWPAGGYVLPSPTRIEGARASSALIYFAGPAAELLAAGAALLWLGPDTMFSSSTELDVLAVQSFALAAVLGAGMNLIPTSAAGSASDGLGIFLSAAAPPEQFEHQMAYPHRVDALMEIDAGRPQAALQIAQRELARLPDNPFLKCLRARCLAENGEREAAMESLKQLRAEPRWSDALEAERLHAAAAIAIACDDRELFVDAEAACRAALERAPGTPEFLITHGTLLIEGGRHAEAARQLKQAYKATRQPALEDRCLKQLAIVSDHLGETRDAQLYREAYQARARPRRLD